ncbi:efflux RND transporter permease subunit [Aestuariibaculum sp. M13]|uniref:efflux RND transporter permease subunit n=1 Tax=Aestuariibaculum sp. M13 TaxID=2967132 RepID=UPI00215A0ACF|nr:efflux RND transporter permease subunit [Aestuariibaculum sp. M13]MCR8667458.1 efflux RND transporter permease subunit [Aestuariibaculum sp. M13]
MKVSKFKIFIVFIILSVIGIFITPQLSVKLNPSRSLPSITVNYNWANTSPQIIERDVTSLLEAGFSTLKGLKKISSKSSKSKGYIVLEFDKYTNVDISRFETATIIRQLYKKLPKQVSYPTLVINRPNEEDTKAFLSYSINSSASPFDIKETVITQIEPIIGAIHGIDKTQVYGATPKEYVLTYNNSILKKLKLTKLDIIRAIKNNFSKETLSSINFNGNYISLYIQPKNEDLQFPIPITKIGNRIVYLNELTTIKEQEQETQNYYRINGNNSITLNLYASKQANTLTLTNEINRALEKIDKSLPQGYTIIKTYDSTEYLKQELDKIYERSFYTITILLLFILLISKRLNFLIITLISLLANISIAFLFYFAFNVEIQLYSLAGITISLGLIIDNIIVMIDHISHQNNKSVFAPILASTLTTSCALIVVYFLDDKYKVNLIDFALVITINLSVSLLIALFLIPALLEKIKLPIKKEKHWSKILKQKFYDIYASIIFIELRYKKLVILFIILLFGLPIFMLPQKLEKNYSWYEKAYNNTLGNEWYKDNIRPYLDRYLGGSFRLFNYYVFENASYNRNEETKLYVTSAMDKGATVHQMNTVFLEIENYLKQFKEIKQYTTYIYSGDYARLEITFLEEYSKSSFPFMLKSRLIRKALDFGGMDWEINGVGNGFNYGNDANEIINFSVKAKGYNYDNLNNWADSLKIVLEQHPRIQKVLVRENSNWSRKPAYNYQFNIDKERLALANKTPLKIMDELQQMTLSKHQDISINIQGKYIPIRLESEQSKTFDIWLIKNTPIDNLNTPIALKDISNITKKREEENIYKENQEYVRLVEFQYAGAELSGSKFLDEKLKELKPRLPLGYSFEKADTRRWFLNQDKNNNYTFLFFLILLIIYFICSIIFESFKQPFIIISVIPISFIGVFLTFYLFDFNFDQGGLASFVLLSGITVNASIFIIYGFNKLKKDFPNQNKIFLYLEAFKQKIYPITLTITSTILGFIPFVKDGQNQIFWFALGVGTIGGLIFSLIGILFYLPIFTLKNSG